MFAMVSQSQREDMSWEEEDSPAYKPYTPESGVKIAILGLDRFQSVNLAQDVISQIL